MLILLLVLLLCLVRVRRPAKKPVDAVVPNDPVPRWSGLSLSSRAVGKTWLLVASSAHYTDALNHLLGSLQGEWNLSEVVIVLNKSEHFSIEGDLYDTLRTKPVVVKTPKNLFEYTSFLAPSWLKANKDDVFVMIHDTCKVEAGFGSKMTRLSRQFAASTSDIHWISPWGACNLCLIRPSVSKHALLVWDSIDTMTKDDAVDIECDRHEQSIKRWPFVQTCEQTGQVLVGFVRVPFSDKDRVQLRFDTVGLSKFYGVHSKEQPHQNALK